jgi:hypothetical protein
MPDEGFKNAFSQHATAEQIALSAAVQRPISVKCLQEPALKPAWRSKPSWFLPSPPSQRSLRSMLPSPR